MEVMTSVLLCALVALLPQGLGKHTVKTSYSGDVKYNSSLLIQQKPSHNHKLLLNLNAPPLIIKSSELQTVFNDRVCIKCISCMERAIRAHKTHSKVHNVQSDELHEEILTNTINTHKVKREISTTKKPVVDPKREKKITKAKKNKLNKSVTVTKYNIDGAVYALKVKETNTSLLNSNSPDVRASASVCQVYSIKKSFPCESPEGDLMLKLAKRKTNKKGKKEKEKEIETSTATIGDRPSGFGYRKREVDDTQMPENVMSSVEEFY